MDKHTVVTIVVFFCVLVAGMFAFAFIKKGEIDEVKSDEQTLTPEPTVEYPSITRVDAKHYFIDGVHTLVGEIPMPTPCDLLEAEAWVAESYPEQVTLNFSVINNSETCIQVVTPQRFKVEATASSEAVFSARLMSREIELNLIPDGPGETPDEFEVFIKG